MPSLNALRAFEAVGRLGSMAAAAAELHVSVGAISQKVRELEKLVGTPLIRNKGNRVELTEVGANAHQPLDAGFRLLQVGVNRMHAKPYRAQLRLTCEPAFAANWLIGRLPAWRALENSVEILLDPSKELVDIAGRAADIGIRFGKGDYPDLHAIPLFEDEIFPVCAPDFLHAAVTQSGPLREPADLLRHPLLRMSWSRKTGAWPDWEAWLMAAGVLDADDALEGPVFHDTSLLIRAAVDGQGFALGQNSLVQDLVKRGELVAPFGRGLKTGFGYYLVYAIGMGEQEDIARFREWIVSEVKKG